ncbi:MAG: TonB family protein [Thalassotalea sp.]|nr:TonB family protein [Thalassotalea sp.]
MNDEQLDKELAGLYQQRKAQMVAPKVNLAKATKNSTYSFAKLISIFTVGGLASFGIMAVITHFAKSPEHSKPIFTPIHQVNLAEPKTKQTEDIFVVDKVPLPAKPEPPSLLPELDVLTPVKNEAHISDIENITLNTRQVVLIPHLKDPEFLVKPVFKVMPKFPTKSLKDQESGAIRLRYEIDTTGKVQNIQVIESGVTRELQRSAISALAKWRYESDITQQKDHEIIFEFNSKDH